MFIFQLLSILESQLVLKLNENNNLIRFIEESNGFESLEEYLKLNSNTSKAIIPLIIQGLLEKIVQKYKMSDVQGESFRPYIIS